MDKRKVILVTLCVAMALAFGVHYMNEAGAICDGECAGAASYFLKTFAPQLGNTLIVFTLLWWFGAPAVSKYLEARKSRIERDIEECGRIKAQASERAEKAEQMLSELSGRWHSVFTGLTLIDTAAGRTLTRVCETRVHFVQMTPQEIRDYVATGEPLDKAGAYGIQGRGGMFVDRIEGSYSNVVGLPMAQLREMLSEIK